MIYAQIMAGGIGKRMGNVPLPKQFLMLGTKPIIIHTIEKFTLHEEFELIIVSVPTDWIPYTEEILNKYCIDDPRIRIISGGVERNDTLDNALKYIDQYSKINESDLLVTHDAVRPFVTRRIIEDNISALKYFDAVDSVIPAFDTIVEGKDREISAIPIRSLMYQGHTPQSFKISSLKESLSKLSVADRQELSDSAKIMLLDGKKVKMIDSEISNIKITTPYDLMIANAILENVH
ncbi:IspD/TarI family cytidylyltransferase [Lactococcus lactis]|uniref:Ribitol-5-phosphate cytidylyltransferase n=1 Tax=Lactococcus lactis subsp. lactis TaxID=1360 RepID=A0A2N5WFA9_LACLL|nr:2-C-methyl-D-erythritol 4-phosphate cytidylyltransferase [Lactococcus lactis]PLW60930.1 2-C-methyl-D-erythritol 4-phosphate cytidylyltransferase 1 [Lactococcus lactis subsp. lactis]